MTPAEVAAILRQFNEWRRSDYEPSEQPAPPDPREISEAIDAAIEMIERLEAAESSVAWHQRRWMALQMHQKKMREPERTILDALKSQEPVAWLIDWADEPDLGHYFNLIVGAK